MAPLAFIARRHLRSKHSFSFISLISYLAVIGLAIGVAVLILTMGILTGFENEVQEKIISFDGHIRVRGFLDNAIPQKSGRLDTVLASLAGIAARAPYIHRPAMIRIGDETESVFVEGIPLNAAKDVFGTPEMMTAGDFNFGTDTVDGREIVLGEVLARKLGITPGSRVVLVSLESLGVAGKAPRLGQYRVAGIYKTGLKEYDESILYMDLSSAQELFGLPDQISGEIIMVRETERAQRVADAMEEDLGYPFTVATWKERHYNLFSWLSVQKFPITVIFALIALIAIVNITSSLTMIVMEKSRDVGVLRAMGFSRSDVSRLFLVEGGVIGITGVVSGILLASVLGFLQSRFGLLKIPEDVYFMGELPLAIVPHQVAVIAATGLVLALAASIYPAWKSAGIPPARAVRYE